MNNNIDKFLSCISDSNNIVFFGGAGVSTESGIPDFRSTDGLYHKKYKYAPETILSHSFFMKNTREFYEFYKSKMIYLEAQPNVTHYKLALLEKQKKLKAVITQNIDGLHQKAGSNEVLELHGSIYRNYCIKCHKFYDIKTVLNTENIPTCNCGGRIKPDVVLYEEGLDEDVLEAAVSYIEKAEVLIIGGTSLSVYPAAGLIKYFNGKNLILINKCPTSYDDNADILIQEGLGYAFANIN